MAKWEFDEAFMNAFQFQQKLNQQRDEHIQQMRFNYRQLMLIDEDRDKALEQDNTQFQEKIKTDQTQFDATTKYRYDALNQDQTQFGMKLDLDTEKMNQDFQLGNKQIGLGYSKLNEDKRQFDLLLPIKEMDAEADYIKKTADATATDPTTERKIAELVGKINQAGSVESDEYIGRYTEELIDLTGLKNDTNIIWQDIKDGEKFENSIESLNSYRKSKGMPEYTADQKNYLKLYFRNRQR